MNKQGPYGIPYCDHTWSPVTGCFHGCTYCFARRIAQRFKGSKAFPNGFAPSFHPGRLTEPLKLKRPSRIFVSDMGDLFGDWVPTEWIKQVLQVVEQCPQHTFLFLTKNPKRYADFVFPSNAWIGTSVENQAAADERIPLLLRTPAATVRFISAEPLLELVDLTSVQFNKYTTMNVLEGCGINLKSVCQAIPNIFSNKLNWVIVGAESGPNARPMDEGWVESLRDQCISAGTPFFYKQKIVNGKKVVMPELEGQLPPLNA
ncbi:phage protein Gp37/Gp68 [Peptococcaceae bacterium CEB3]|nr:phage protein Gp37/Gp68 [Peptococcaceae bacterium CEB3]